MRLVDRRDDARPPSSMRALSHATPLPDGILDASRVWIDVEASSLGRRSYPIEIGWAFDDLSGGSILIRPEVRWKDWDWRSEMVHGIRRSDAIGFGKPVPKVAWEIARAIGGLTAFADTEIHGNGGSDRFWLGRLFHAAGVPIPFSLTAPPAPAEDRSGRVVSARTIFPRTHQAGEDAVSLAAEWRACVDDGFAGKLPPIDVETTGEEGGQGVGADGASAETGA